jgi:hypothetical protein
MATKEQLTYTDVRNAAAQADALEAVDNYMQVQQRRRTGYTTKADPTEKWHTGQTFTDYDGTTYQLRVQYNADGSIRNQQKVAIGKGKIPKATDEKPPLSYEQVGKKYNIFKEKEGADSAEVQDLGRRYTDIGNVEDINLQLNMLEEYDKDLDIASSYNKPSTADPDVTYENVKNRFNAIKTTLNPSQISWVEDRMKAITPLKETDPVGFKQAVKVVHNQLNKYDYTAPSTKETPLTSGEVKTKLDLFTKMESKDSEEVKHYNTRWAQIIDPNLSQNVRDNLIAELNKDLDSSFAYDKPSKEGLGNFTVTGVREHVESLPDGDSKTKLLDRVKKAGAYPQKSQNQALSAIFSNVNELLREKAPTVSGTKALVDKQTEVKNVQRVLAIGAFKDGDVGIAETHYLRHVEARISEAAAKGGEDYNGHVVYDATGIEPSRVHGTVLAQDFGMSEEGKEIQKSIDIVKNQYAKQTPPMTEQEAKEKILDLTRGVEYKTKLFEFLQKAQRTTAGRDKYQRILHITVRPQPDWYENESEAERLMRIWFKTVELGDSNDEPD